MELTISIGWWMLPALFTAGTVAWAALAPGPRSSGYGGDIAGVFVLAGLVIANLAIWLVWALLT